MKIFEKRLVSFLLALIMVVGLLPPVSMEAKAETTGLEGKTISILGDSISTYQNYSNGTAAGTTNSTITNGAVYYPRSGFDVTVDSTWWYQAAQELGLDVLVNNSWSGSCLLNTRSGTVGAYVDRCVQLHDDTGDNAGQEPDIIAIFLGTNDYYTYPNTLGSYESIAFDTLITKTEAGYAYAEPATSMEAYAIILHKIAQRYPQAQVYCFTLLPRVNSTSQPTAVNEDIKQLANHFGAITVDLHNCGIQPDSTHMGDNLHPNSAGMDAMTNAFVSAVLKNSGEMTYRVSFNLDGVVAMEGTTRTVIAGDEFRATLKGKNGNRRLNVSVKMGGADITEACYVDGVVQIPVVNGDVVITASLADRDPLNFRWEYDAQKNALVSGSGDGNTENALTMTSGSITDGKFSKVKYTLDEAVILKHDKPWVIEWKSSGTWSDTTDGALLFAGAETSTTADTPYLYRRHNSDFIAFGVSTGGQYHNYGVKLGANGIDGTVDHTYKLENRISADGSNMVYLYVDDQEIGPMNHHWVGGTDKKETVDWLNGQDLVFTHMGTTPHTIGNCYIDYIQVWEDGEVPAEPQWNPQNFRWEYDAQKNALVSGSSDGNTENALTMTSGSITDGKFSKVKYTLDEAVILKHDKPWVIEWKSSGTWTDTTDGALLFAGDATSSTADKPYLYRRHNSDFIAFGVSTGGQYHNYGVKLGANGIDGTIDHTYKLENRISADGSNMVYLYVDDQEIGPMNHHWIGGTDKKETVDWLNGQDLVFTHMGTSPHTIGNCYIDYIQVWENGKPYERSPLNFRWEYDAQKDALVSGSANGNTENALTMTSGSITDGKFSKVKYTLDETVILKHDKPWVIEWKSSGTWSDTTDGALLFAGDATSSTADKPYLYRRHNSDFIAFGVSTGGQYHNYGVKLGANGIDGTIDHTYKLENRISADGSNMVYLYVDDQEIGPMNHHWVGGTDKKETVDWLNGQDLVFSHMGTNPHTIGNCYIDYIQVWENGKPDERSLLNFRWEIENNAMVSVTTNGNTVNDLTLNTGSITGGTLKNIRYSLNKAVNLYHDVPWVIEWRSSGNWDGMLLASNADTSVNGTTYLFRFASMNFLALGDHTNTWNNYGLIHEIDMSVPHLFRLENRIGADGTNTVYLLVDGVEIDAMHHYYNSGTNQNKIINWANGRDLVFGNIGTSSHPVNNLQLEYLQIWEKGHDHDYRSAVTAPTCTEKGYTTYTCDCGSSYVSDYVDAVGHSYENGGCKVCGAMASNPYAGKTIACIGDSITAAYGVTKDKTDYVKLLADRLEMNYIRLGASGTSLCANGGRVCNIDKLTESKLQGADVVTIAMGINDFCGAGAGYYKLGDINSTDSSTIYGAVRMWCEQIVELRKTDSLKDTRFYFMTPLITSWNNSVTSARNWDQSKVNIHGYTLRDLCNAIIEVAALYDVAVIDMNLISGLYYVSAEDNNIDVFGGDGVHPGDEGHAMMAAALEDMLLERYLLDDHDHSYGSWIITTYPDCEDGEEKRVCEICRATESRALPAIPTEENVHLSQKAKLQPDGSFTFTLEIYASEKVALYGDAVIRYVLNQGFVMTEMSQIRAVRISEALKDAVLNENKAEAEDLIVRVNESIVDVTGFDLSKEYISDEHSGSKLVVTISHVEATDDVIWGESMDISTADSGIWSDGAMAVPFAKSGAFFRENVYVMDYAQRITLDEEGILHLDADSMGCFSEANTKLEMEYGTAVMEDGAVVYIPDTMQWDGYDRFYAFADQNDVCQWTKVAVIPANNVYFEDSFVATTAENAAAGAGIYYTNGTKPEDVAQDVWDGWCGQWESVSDNKTGNSEEDSSDVQGWIEDLAGQTGFTGGSAHLVQAMLGQNANGIPKATFTFTGTGVDIYSFTNNTTGTVMVQVSDVKGIYPSSYYIVDTGANTAEGYYQVPTISFVGKGHSTYQVTIMVTTAAASENRFAFYLDGIRVYNPLGEDAKDETVEDAYGDEMHAVFGSVRQMLLDAGSFTGATGEGSGFVFLDRMPESENAGNTNVIGTYAVYGPKNEVYLAKGQAIAFKVDENLYSRVQVGMKSLTGENVQAVVSYFDEESDAAAQGLVTISHTADLYYELMPMEGYVVIRNTSDAILAVTKVKLMVSGDPQQISVQVEKVSQAEVLEAVEEFDELPMMAYSLRSFRPDVEITVPGTSAEDVAEIHLRVLLDKLFGSVRKWLTK